MENAATSILLMFFRNAPIIVVFLCITVTVLILKKRNDMAQKSAELERKAVENASYVKRLPDDFSFSHNITELLNELQMICYEITTRSAAVQYGGNSFVLDLYLALDVKTKLTKALISIHPGGEWSNDFNILLSVKNERVYRIIKNSFSNTEGLYGISHQVNGIAGLYERFTYGNQIDTEISESMLHVGYDTLIKGWSGAPSGAVCVVEHSELHDSRSLTGKIGIHVVYRYSLARN